MPPKSPKTWRTSVAGITLLLAVLSALAVLTRVDSPPNEQADTSSPARNATHCVHGVGCVHNHQDPNRPATRRPVNSYPELTLTHSVVEDSKAITQSKPGESFKLNFGENLILDARVRFTKTTPGNRHAISMELIGRKGWVHWLEKADGNIMGNIMLKEGDENIIYRYSGRDGDLVIRQITQQEFICSSADNDESVGMPASEDPFTPVEKAAIVPLLNSLPGAEAVVYIDVDGEVVTGTRWNSLPGRPETINAAPAGFDEARIREVWEEVAEDMRPFKINVTTDRTVFDAAAIGKRMMCIVTPTDTAVPGTGGVAFLDSFFDGNDDPCWAYNRSVGSCAMTVSHEVGHTFGLNHDGLTSQSEPEYHRGNGTWGPIMGAPFGLDVVTWSNGDYDGSTNTEDDLQIINDLSANFRDDQFGDSDEEAFDIAGEPGDEDVELEGVIETPDDIDVFLFMTSGGPVTLTVDPEGVTIGESKFVTNMNVRVELYSEAGDLLVENDPEDSYSASVTTTLEPGNYTLHVTGTNSGNADASGFNDYGSIGQYNITGNIPGLGGDGDLDPPTADLSNPGNGEVLDVSATNTPTFLEVTFADIGKGVDPATIDGDELLLSGSGVGTVILEEGAPTLVSGTTYRYGLSGSFVQGVVNVEFVAGSFADLSTITNFNVSETESFTVEVLDFFQIMDDADAGFTSTGGWDVYEGNPVINGYNNDFTYAEAGTGSEIASWTFTGLASGRYEVAVTWHDRNVYRATNAPYTVLDGSTVVDSTSINQSVAPVADYLRGGELFEIIFASVDITSGTLVVELSDNADNYVIADAVRIELLGPDVAPPVADLTSPADGDTISPAALNAQGYIEVVFSDEGTGLDASTIDGDEIFISGSGVNDVILDGPVNMVSEGVYRYGFTGEFVEGTVNVEFVAGTFADSADIPNTNATETESFTVAVPPPPPSTQIIDDADEGFTATEGWSVYTGNTVINGYNTDFTFADAGTGTEVATWTFSGLIPGSYEVAITWNEREIYRATNAPFKVYDAANPAAFLSAPVDQSVAPAADYVESGEPFQIVFASVDITGDTLVVELSDDAGDFVIADAVRIELLLPAGPDVTPPVADLTSPADGDTITPTELNGRNYIEVSLSDAGDGLDASTIGADEISISGSGVGTAVLDGTVSLVSEGVYRYGFTGGFEEGTVSVDFVAGSFADLAGNVNALETESFTVAVPPPPPSTQIIDDADAGFSATSGWSVYTGNEVIFGYNSDLTYIKNADGAPIETATWTFSGLLPGTYEVAVTWREREIYRATNAPFMVYDGTTLADSTIVNQRVAPVADYVEGDEPFQIVFASVDITGDTLVVELSNDTDDFVIADAVRLELLTLAASVATTPSANLTNPGNGHTLDPAALNAQGYLEVTFLDADDGIDTSTIDGDEISLSGSGVGTATLDGTAVLVSGTTYRYGFTGEFVGGLVDVEFVAGTFADLAIPNVNLSEREGFSVVTPAPSQVLYRVNSGGGQLTSLDGLAEWSGDTSGSPSIFVNSSQTNNTYSTKSSVSAGPTVPAEVPLALFQSERWDSAASAEMQWNFPVENGTYEVRLYFAEIYSGAGTPGKRVFDVVIENELALDDYDVVADAGAMFVGVMKNFLVGVSDGMLSIELLHVIQNPAIKGIEIIDLNSTGGPVNTAPEITPVADQNHFVADSVQLQVLASDADGDSLSYSATGLPSGLSIDASTGLISGEVASDAETSVPYTVTITVTDDGSPQQSAESTFGWVVNTLPSSNQVLYRVNSGGGQLGSTDGLPDWSGDTSGSPSSYVNSSQTNNTYTTKSTISAGPAVPGEVPLALFQSERWDSAASAEMQWNFPVDNAYYEVRLYFAEIYSGAGTPGKRVFDVVIENELALDDYDVVADAGAMFVGVMKSFLVEVSDGMLSIELLHVIQNPAIKGIEIIGIPIQTTTHSGSSIAPAEDQLPVTSSFSAQANHQILEAIFTDGDGDGVSDEKDAFPDNPDLTKLSDYVDAIIDYVLDDEVIFDEDWREISNEDDFAAELEALLELLIAAEEAQDSQWEALLYTEALKLVDDELISRIDGFQEGGSHENDWIVTQEAQAIVHADLALLSEYLWLMKR